VLEQPALEAIAMLTSPLRLQRNGTLKRSKSRQPRIEWMEPRTPLTIPAVTGLNPTSGTEAGGTPVTISGTGFTGATLVDFGT
jgi:IPT/TIG domain